VEALSQTKDPGKIFLIILRKRLMNPLLKKSFLQLVRQNKI